jgi:transcription antitermination factor NusA-like protein
MMGLTSQKQFSNDKCHMNSRICAYFKIIKKVITSEAFDVHILLIIQQLRKKMIEITLPAVLSLELDGVDPAC